MGGIRKILRRPCIDSGIFRITGTGDGIAFLGRASIAHSALDGSIRNGLEVR